jgi:hypothetical protein
MESENEVEDMDDAESGLSEDEDVDDNENENDVEDGGEEPANEGEGESSEDDHDMEEEDSSGKSLSSIKYLCRLHQIGPLFLLRYGWYRVRKETGRVHRRFD